MCINNSSFRGMILREKMTAMKMQILIMIGLCCLLTSGCARFIVPEIGAVAEEGSRVPYEVNEKKDGVLVTKDLHLEYSLTGSDDGAHFTGKLFFDRSLTDSFPVIKTFFLKMSWLDADGYVLQTVDITPLYGYLNQVPNRLQVNRKIDTVPGSAFINFNYYGVFQGEKPDVSEEWTIFLFPFTTP